MEHKDIVGTVAVADALTCFETSSEAEEAALVARCADILERLGLGLGAAASEKMLYGALALVRESSALF